MSYFFGINKEVLPLKANLVIQEARLASAQGELSVAQAELDAKQRELDIVQGRFDDAMREKQVSYVFFTYYFLICFIQTKIT